MPADNKQVRFVASLLTDDPNIIVEHPGDVGHTPDPYAGHEAEIDAGYDKLASGWIGSGEEKPQKMDRMELERLCDEIDDAIAYGKKLDGTPMTDEDYIALHEVIKGAR